VIVCQTDDISPREMHLQQICRSSENILFIFHRGKLTIRLFIFHRCNRLCSQTFRTESNSKLSEVDHTEVETIAGQPSRFSGPTLAALIV
jgi:hypothetical protein